MHLQRKTLIATLLAYVISLSLSRFHSLDSLISSHRDSLPPNTISKYRQIHHGLLQDAVLSTTLFNEIPDIIEKSKMKTALFVDDLIMSTSTTKKNKAELEATDNKH